MNKTYIAIDLKSYYSSAECVSKGLDPLDTNLVVADVTRTDKTICLAVSPTLKSYGVSSRPRLFEVKQIIKKENKKRLNNIPSHRFRGKSFLKSELDQDPTLEIDFLVASPRMAYYVKQSALIYETYLQYISPDDIHVYSIDEVFIDATSYLSLYQMSAHDLAMTLIQEVLKKTGITATAGIGTNLYLAKVAMDIVAKHIPPDKDGVRIASLDEMSYRQKLWDYRPLNAFWRVGKGYVKKLETLEIFTMGDIAQLSLDTPDLFYKLFGVNAELLIDHAWGYESTTITDIKNYQPQEKSLGSGQVLSKPYSSTSALIVLKEMIEQLSLDLVEKKLKTSKIIIIIGYDLNNINSQYNGSIENDRYGRKIPKNTRLTLNFKNPTSSTSEMIKQLNTLYNNKIRSNLLIRRLNISATHLISSDQIQNTISYEQLDIFNTTIIEKTNTQDQLKEQKLQETLINIKGKYGKNAIFKGRDLEEDATALERNDQIGGHHK